MSVAQSGSIGKGAKNSTSTINIGSLPGLGPPARRGGQRQRARHLQSKQPTAFSFFFSHLLSFLAPTPKALLFAFGVFWLFFFFPRRHNFLLSRRGWVRALYPPPRPASRPPCRAVGQPEGGGVRPRVPVPPSPPPKPGPPPPARGEAGPPTPLRSAEGRRAGAAPRQPGIPAEPTWLLRPSESGGRSGGARRRGWGLAPPPTPSFAASP